MRTAAVVLLLSTLLGCSAFEGKTCTLIGGLDGVVVRFAPELQLVSGSLTVTACDDSDCASFEDHWARRPRIGGLPSFTATFDDLGRSFEPGTVSVTAELRDEAGTLVAERTQDVELSREHPNGRACDGDGYVNGSLDLGPEDAVAAGA